MTVTVAARVICPPVAGMVVGAITAPVIVGPLAVSYKLPIPVMRRQIGTVNLGIGCVTPGAERFSCSLAENFAVSLSSFSLSPRDGTALGVAIARAHAKAVEVIFRAESPKGASAGTALASALSCADEAERLGADGILFLPADAFWRDGAFPAEIRKLAASVHNRGMTLAVAISPEILSVFHPVVLFDQVPSPECPDELFILCYGAPETDEIPSIVSLQQMENALLKIMAEKIPLSRVSVEVRLSAQAGSTGGKTRQPVALEPGELEKVLAEAGAGSAIRMGDGSLMLGYKGVDYLYEDLTGIARKMRFLRKGEFVRIHGVHILYDGLGAPPDAAGLRELAEVFEGK